MKCQALFTLKNYENVVCINFAWLFKVSNNDTRVQTVLHENMRVFVNNMFSFFFTCNCLKALFSCLTLGVVGWCEDAVYLTSLGCPTDIGLQLGKACYPCSG